MESISWKLIDKYFKDNQSNLVSHHLDSYNDFFSTGINNIFRENNPIRFIERLDKNKDKEKENDKLETNDQFIKVLNCKDATKQTEVYSEWFSCLITTNRRIKIEGHIFWDWEDDELTN